MHSQRSASARRRRVRRARRAFAALVVALAVVAAAMAGSLVMQSISSSAQPVGGGHDAASTGDGGDATGEAAGDLPDGATPFDEYPAITRLDPALLDALRRAATDAAAEGIEFRVNSGWRSPAHQDRLLDEAVAEYGSETEAARWVAPPEKSAHVSGDAVDLGDYDAVDWLAERGEAYGLCQVYDNEAWHFELFADAPDVGCPAKYFDPTEDPRMQ
ncbi:M15 family metallopeptidase [Agromyces sp. NPDC127015]|uniref:M15 family metallopeptidase n=1 Tax=Agromyces sp. NPDC127015 TaxID=3347108 RepID=UPI003668FD66